MRRGRTRAAVAALVAAVAAAVLPGCAWMPPVQTAALRAEWAAQRLTDQPADQPADQSARQPAPPSAAQFATQPGQPLTPASPPTRAASLSASRPASAWLKDLAFFPQTEQYCGPAVLATVLTAAGIAADPQQLVAQVYLPAREGTLQAEMLAGARRAGGLATIVPGRLDALMTEVAQGRPVAVLLNLGLSWWTQWHYATVVGYDRAAEQLILHSGAQRDQRIALTTFEHTWARTQHWAFVVTRPGQLPATAQRAEAEQATVALERVAPPPQLLRAWQRVHARWPDSLLALMGVGNALYALQRWEDAGVRFDAAARQHKSAAAFNNLALVRQRLGDAAGARRAARAALDLALRDEPALLPAIRETLAGLSGG